MTGDALGWGLAALAVAVGYWGYGWPGVALAATAIVFWLLLQFSRALHTLRLAAESPVGQVPSAVMLHSRLHAGMRLTQVIKIARSLGRRVGDDPETFAWCDESGAEVQIAFARGRSHTWQLKRKGQAGPDA
jgi:Flp pilus assembly protein TadB